MISGDHICNTVQNVMQGTCVGKRAGGSGQHGAGTCSDCAIQALNVLRINAHDVVRTEFESEGLTQIEH